MNLWGRGFRMPSFITAEGAAAEGLTASAILCKRRQLERAIFQSLAFCGGCHAAWLGAQELPLAAGFSPQIFKTVIQFYLPQ